MTARVVYEDDLVQLWHGNYKQELAMLRSLDVDMVMADPPYGETNLDWDQWPAGWVEHARSLTDALWCWGSFRMFRDHMDEFAAWKYSHEIVWEKQNGTGLDNQRFRRVHELATLWYQGKWSDIHHAVPTTHDARRRFVRKSTKPAHLHGAVGANNYSREEGGPRLMRSVIQARNEHGRSIHPTQKPLAAVSPLIEYSVPGGGLVVDLFAGSATTALAARQLGRRCIAFEAREDYVMKAANRLSQQDFDLGALPEEIEDLR